MVGFDNELTTVDGYNFFAGPFVAIGENTVDIQSIKLVGDGVGGGSETFNLWEGAPAVVAGSDFMYLDYGDGTFGWEDEYFGTEFSMPPAQGFVIQCGPDIMVNFAGEVTDETATAETVNGFNFFGNPFAAPISIQNIKLIGDGVGGGSETFNLWEGAPAVVAGSDFMYLDYGDGTFGWEDEYFGTEFSIDPGQGFVIQCGSDIDVEIASPYSL